MEESKFVLIVIIFAVLAVAPCHGDFQDSEFYVEYIYHSRHDLLLTIVDDDNTCYFTHVDNSTKEALNNCHRDYLEQEIYLKIMSEDPAVVILSSLQIMRQTFGDIFADYRCTNSDIYELKMTFGSHYITQCKLQNLANVGK